MENDRNTYTHMYRNRKNCQKDSNIEAKTFKFLIKIVLNILHIYYTHCYLSSWTANHQVFMLKFLFKILFIFRETGVDRERKAEKHQCAKEQSVASHMPPNGDPSSNPGMCPHWEANWWPFGLWDYTQPTEPHQSGLCENVLNTLRQLT